MSGIFYVLRAPFVLLASLVGPVMAVFPVPLLIEGHIDMWTFLAFQLVFIGSSSVLYWVAKDEMRIGLRKLAAWSRGGSTN